MTPLRRPGPAGLAALGLPVLAGAWILAVAVSTVAISPETVIRAILSGMGLLPADAVSQADRTVILMIRIPRVLAATLAGGGLALSGTVLQGLFRNPLADPGLLGVSAGAGFGSLLAILTGIASFYVLPLSAFLGALLGVGLILGISAAAGRGGGSGIGMVPLILSGMAVSAMFSAMTSLLLSISNEFQVSNYIFWTMGGLANRRWEHVLAMAPLVAAAAVLVLSRARDLDILLLGDEAAKALGVHPRRTRLVLILAASLCTAAIVSVTGPIGFVGLLVPHMLRLLIGPAHRPLAVASFFGGAVFLVLCDLLARVLAISRGQEISVGVVTALLGAPFFLYLLLRSVRGKGGMG